MIRPTREDDRAALMDLLRESGQFDDAGVAFVEATLNQHLTSPGPEIWLTAEQDQVPVGVAYCAPEPVGPRVWNLLMLWLRPDQLGRGIGRALVQQVEDEVRRHAARLLIVETSSLPAFETARAFYARRGFVHEATVRDYFGDGDDKLILTRRLASAGPGTVRGIAPNAEGALTGTQAN